MCVLVCITKLWIFGRPYHCWKWMERHIDHRKTFWTWRALTTKRIQRLRRSLSCMKANARHPTLGRTNLLPVTTGCLAVTFHRGKPIVQPKERFQALGKWNRVRAENLVTTATCRKGATATRKGVWKGGNVVASAMVLSQTADVKMRMKIAVTHIVTIVKK